MKKTDKKRKKRRHFRHLNQRDRDRIEALLDSGHNQEEVATILQFDPGAISREIQKHTQKDGRYRAVAAQGKANVKRSSSKYQGMQIEKDSILKADIIAGLTQKRSPDEMAGRWELENRPNRVGKDAIYKWLYSRLRATLLSLALYSSLQKTKTKENHETRNDSPSSFPRKKTKTRRARRGRPVRISHQIWGTTKRGCRVCAQCSTVGGNDD